MTKPLNHTQAKAVLSHAGVSVAQWARERGFSEELVRQILAGRKKCGYGASHNIAVALGMKAGVPTTRPGRSARAQQDTNHAGAAA